MERRQAYLENMGIPIWVSRHKPEATSKSATAAIPLGHAPLIRPQPAVPPHQQHTRTSQTATDWPSLIREVSECRLCALHKTRTHPVFGTGNPKARLMFVGEGPGQQEDLQGEPFVGRAGQLLDRMLKAVNLEREEVYIANVVKCRPPNNRNPLSEEIAHCSSYLEAQLDLVQPELLVALGGIAAKYLLQTASSLGALRGKIHRHKDTPLLVTYHPAYLLRSPAEKSKSWEDLKCMASLLKSL